jgi:hypothetical protein
MLQAMLGQGIQDMYLINDSHWSYKEGEVVAQKLNERILPF